MSQTCDVYDADFLAGEMTRKCGGRSGENLRLRHVSRHATSASYSTTEKRKGDGKRTTVLGRVDIIVETVVVD
jgi:hypothetical protein